MSEPAQWVLLATVGTVAGALNVIAGGGSFLTLPVLIFMGLPAGLANGTNRVGILLQNVAAVWSFDRDGVLDRRLVGWAAVPATVGTVVGVRLALLISDQAFERVLAVLMVALSLAALWRPGRAEVDPAHLNRPMLAAGFLLVGVYAGFIQAGVGFIILAVTTLVGLDLVRGNAVKVSAILCATVLSVVLFAWQGLVRWDLGLALAAGMSLGGWLGARITVRRGQGFIRLVVTLACVVFAIKLWLR